MPELPEVETILRQLKPLYVGEMIRKVKVKPVRIFQNVTPAEFTNKLSGREVRGFSRRGKYLVLECNGLYVVFHLGMSGIFLKNKTDSLFPNHIHIEFYFESGKMLFYQDVRKFGKIWLYFSEPRWPALGIDPFDKKFTLKKFRKLLSSRAMNVKQFLMEQSTIAGIGNIYANEILFRAGILPLRKTAELSVEESTALYYSIKNILKEAIKRYGTSYSAYRTVSGGQGENQNFLKVYHRENQPCTRCAAVIKKVILGSRSTFYCPKCQR